MTDTEFALKNDKGLPFAMGSLDQMKAWAKLKVPDGIYNLTGPGTDLVIERHDGTVFPTAGKIAGVEFTPLSLTEAQKIFQPVEPEPDDDGDVGIIRIVDGPRPKDFNGGVTCPACNEQGLACDACPRCGACPDCREQCIECGVCESCLGESFCPGCGECSVCRDECDRHDNGTYCTDCCPECAEGDEDEDDLAN